MTNLYVFGMNRALPVPADKKVATRSTAASGQPRDRTARWVTEPRCHRWGYRRNLDGT